MNSMMNAEEGLRDIVSPLALGLRPTLWFYILLVLIIIFGIMIYRYIKKRRECQPLILPSVQHSTPEEEILKRLHQLEELAGEGKKFHFELSLALRNFLELKLAFPFSDLTTEEIQSRLKNERSLKVACKESLLRLLRNSDLVKFANMNSSKEEDLELIKSAKEIVKSTESREEIK